MMRVKNKPGRLIQKPSVGVIRPMLFMVYNGEKTDAGIVPVDMEWEVPRDQYHGRMLARGDLLLVDEPKEAPKKAVKKPKEEDKK